MPNRKNYTPRHGRDYPCHCKVWEITDKQGRVTRVISPLRREAVTMFCDRMGVAPEDFPKQYTVKRRTEPNTCFGCGCIIPNSEALCSLCKREYAEREAARNEQNSN